MLRDIDRKLFKLSENVSKDGIYYRNEMVIFTFYRKQSSILYIRKRKDKLLDGYKHSIGWLGATSEIVWEEVKVLMNWEFC